MKKWGLMAFLALAGWAGTTAASERSGPLPEPPQALDATFDISDDLWRARARLTERNIEEAMCHLRRLGVRRVYWLVVPEFTLTAGSLRDDGDGLAAVGHAVRAAHRAGLEFYAVLKPFETGLTGGSLPPIVPLPPGRRTAEDLTGNNYRLAPFAMDRPDLLMRRHPLDLRENEPVAALRLWSDSDAPTKLTAGDLELWTGPINGVFTRYPGRFQMTESVRERNGKAVRVLTLSGLRIPPEQRYVQVRSRRRDPDGRFLNRSSSFIEFLGRDGTPIPSTGDQGAFTREAIEQGQLRLWLSHRGTWGIPEEARLPETYGSSPAHLAFRFETGRVPPPRRTLDGNGADDGYAAAVRGVPLRLNTLQPMYPEVRAYWMEQVAGLVAAGIDGIDFRVCNHSAWVSEPLEYGFDPPVVEAYRERYGLDILSEPFDREAWRALQGEAYTEFYRQARAYTRERGVSMQVHVAATMGVTIPYWEINNVPANILFPWRQWITDDLADSVLLKLLPWWWGSAAGTGADFALEIAGLARLYDKPVSWEWRFDTWWLTRGHSPKALTWEDADRIARRSSWGWNRPGIDAVVLYEVFDFMFMDTETGFTYVSPAFEKILEAVRAGIPIPKDAPEYLNHALPERTQDPCAGPSKP